MHTILLFVLEVLALKKTGVSAAKNSDPVITLIWPIIFEYESRCLTDDIVATPPFGFCDVLINPANEAH